MPRLDEDGRPRLSDPEAEMVADAVKEVVAAINDRGEQLIKDMGCSLHDPDVSSWALPFIAGTFFSLARHMGLGLLETAQSRPAIHEVAAVLGSAPAEEKELIRMVQRGFRSAFETVVADSEAGAVDVVVAVFMRGERDRAQPRH